MGRPGERPLELLREAALAHAGAADGGDELWSARLHRHTDCLQQSSQLRIPTDHRRLGARRAPTARAISVRYQGLPG